MAAKQMYFASLLISSVLVGCGGGSGGNEANTAQTINTEDTTEKAETTAIDSPALLKPALQGQVITETATLEWTMQPGVTYNLYLSDSQTLSAASINVDSNHRIDNIRSPFNLLLEDTQKQYLVLEAVNDQDQVFSDTKMVIAKTNALQTSNDQSYTKLNANGEVVADDANDWDCILDNYTGLIWEVESDANPQRYVWTETSRTDTADGFGLCDSSLAGACTTTAAKRETNRDRLCGQGNWRLPSTFELAGLSRLDTSMPAIDTDYFPNTQNGHYWAAEVFAKNPNYAWNVSFDYGHAMTTNANAIDSEHGYLRLVSPANNTLFNVAQ